VTRNDTTTLGGGGRSRSRGVAADELRRHNLSAVLARLHYAGPVSRSELTAMTGLNRSTIGDLISELTALGLVEEGPGPAASGPGRPSPQVRTRPQSAAVLAVELAVDSIALATAGLGGHVFNRIRVARPRGHFSPEETVKYVARLAGPLLEALPTAHMLAGVGVAVVGVTRRSDGFVHVAPNLGWRDIPLGDMLSMELGAFGHVLVANEADLGALGEHGWGAGVGVGHLVYVSGEVGIGTGIIVDDKPLLGSAGYAGEAGHTLINPQGLKCRCGAVGCWETEAGETALLRHAGMRPSATGLSMMDAVSERAAAGDRVVLDALAEVGRWLGIGIGNLINLFNPERVVLGGMYHRLFEFLEGPATRGARRALAAPASLASIVRSGLGQDAALIGAVELVLSDVIADPAGAVALAASGGPS